MIQSCGSCSNPSALLDHQIHDPNQIPIQLHLVIGGKVYDDLCLGRLFQQDVLV
jgi:hypothetical protein